MIINKSILNLDCASQIRQTVYVPEQDEITKIILQVFEIRENNRRENVPEDKNVKLNSRENKLIYSIHTF